jgi:hypothetical protein
LVFAANFCDKSDATGAYWRTRNTSTLALSNVTETSVAQPTLKHEGLGHFSINTFTPEKKRAVGVVLADMSFVVAAIKLIP